MHIKKLSLINFKNYEEANLELHPKVNCFVGDNGVGKTNLLDGVHYLCMCKSYFNSSDAHTTRHGQEYMVLQAEFLKNETENEIYCGLKTGKRKIFRKNKKEYPKLSEHIGQFPVVMVSPSDSALILEGSEERRRYMNAVISQYNPGYLEASIKYNKILLQRNKLLKEMAHHSGSADLINIYDEQLVPLAKTIWDSRKEFVSKLVPVFKKFYEQISNGRESVELCYFSQLHDKEFSVLLEENKRKDRIAQTTTAGIHKDDLELLMQGNPIKKIGSQGQQKTFLVALKLAQFSFLNEINKIPPILLLDDIFDKFDGKRVMEILHIVSEEEFGQIFITHTNEVRMRELLKELTGTYKLFKVEDNSIALV